MLLALCLVACLILYLLGAYQQFARVNTDPRAGDQSAYLGYARQVHDDPVGFVGSRNRMPAYPSLLALITSHDLSDAEFFQRGKRFNVLLSLLLLAAVYLLLRFHEFEPPVSLLLVGIAAATVFVWRCAYVQVELLFYTVFLHTFAAAMRLFARPSLGWAFLAGGLAALAYLTKASALPMVAGTVLLLLVRQAVEFRRPSASPELNAPELNAPARPRPWALALALSTTFLILVSPYLANSQRHFGRWFYNVNTTHAAWNDSTPDWNNLRPGSDPWRYSEQVREMSPDEIPSASRYWREHSPSDIGARIAKGALRYVRYEGTSQFLAQLFLGVYALFALVFTAQHRERVRGWLAGTDALFALLFCIGIFLGYALLVCFYAGVAVGDRFVQPLFLPAWYVGFKLLKTFEAEGCALRTPWGAVSVARCHQAAALLMVLVVVVWIPPRIGVIRAED